MKSLGQRTAIVSILALMGCAAPVTEEAPPAKVEASGGESGALTVLKADPAWGANLSFRSRGRTLLLQTRVGATLQPEYRKPGGPEHEMDARIVDQNGKSFILVRGGDGYADPQWAKEIAAEQRTDSPPRAEREGDLRVIIEDLPSALASLGPSLREDVGMLAGLAAHVSLADLDPSDAKDVSGAPATPATPVAGDDPTGATSAYSLRTTNNGCTSNIIFGQRYTCRGCINGFDHTSVTLRNYNGCRGYYDEVVYAMNHSGWGTYGGYDGQIGGGWNAWDLLGQINWEGSQSGTRYGGCSTHYYIGASQGHVCNDDAAYELWQVYDSSWSDWGQSRHGNWSTYFAGPHSCDWAARRPSWWEPTTKWQVPALPPNL